MDRIKLNGSNLKENGEQLEALYQNMEIRFRELIFVQAYEYLKNNYENYEIYIAVETERSDSFLFITLDDGSDRDDKHDSGEYFSNIMFKHVPNEIYKKLLNEWCGAYNNVQIINNEAGRRKLANFIMGEQMAQEYFFTENKENLEKILPEKNSDKKRKFKA